MSPAARRGFSTARYGTARLSGAGERPSAATAPCVTASATNRRPSECSPGNAANRLPGLDRARVVRDRDDVRVTRGAGQSVLESGGEGGEPHGIPPSEVRAGDGERTSAHVVPRDAGAPTGGSCDTTNPEPWSRAATP
jgi:hypothetical protein